MKIKKLFLIEMSTNNNVVTPIVKWYNPIYSHESNIPNLTKFKKDKQLSSVLFLKNLSCWLVDVSKELVSIADLLPD